METLVVDASIAVKWVVEEHGTEAAVEFRSRFRLLAPELLVAECANILWKKVQRGELRRDEAVMAARLLEQATVLSIELSHPAYDCIYLAAARRAKSRFVTADERLLRVIGERGSSEIGGSCISLADLRKGTR